MALGREGIRDGAGSSSKQLVSGKKSSDNLRGRQVKVFPLERSHRGYVHTQGKGLSQQVRDHGWIQVWWRKDDMGSGTLCS